ncbi:calcium-binding protein [Pararhodobacter oceanensis]|uniref:Calcium-binding protein n=1 Tax=Pararhodobacter oceanensis TaxID=2172121 RepID=A0A2T8HVI9_9RHOB|nr:hypothetical protein [Pararhodobacter oceanensis]PVH29459.1 hypothetical protein DDE20_04815 [Pararhodobacter oceanensis]
MVAALVVLLLGVAFAMGSLDAGDEAAPATEDEGSGDSGTDSGADGGPGDLLDEPPSEEEDGSDSGSAEDGTGDEDGTDDIAPPATGITYQMRDGEDLTASALNDTITLADDPDPAQITLDAGDGADLIDLRGVEDGESVLTGSYVDGGAGDDTLYATAHGSTLLGGAGDDEMYLRGDSSLIDGGEGDDLIIYAPPDVWAFGAEWAPTTLEGGLGNDTIDARHTPLVVTRGGAGDDLIEVQGGFQYTGNITPYAVIDHHGGEGDDTLRIHAPWVMKGMGFRVEPIEFYGGEGSDSFEVLIDEGTEIISYGGEEELRLGTTAGTIKDFDSSADQLVIDLRGIDSGFEVGEIRHVVDADGTRILVDMVRDQVTLVMVVDLEGVSDLAPEDVIYRR